MEMDRFDRLAHSVSGLLSRRALAGALGLGALVWPSLVDAKKRGKKKKKVKFNEFGCVSVGGYCKNADQCCSGMCEGKKGKKKCRARGAGTCDQDSPGVCLAANPTTLTCNNDALCYCYATTAGSNFCTEASMGFDVCAECQKDADCVALGHPPEFACAPAFAGACAGACESGMACLPPCGYAPPEPE
jgi:hypothetical protein